MAKPVQETVYFDVTVRSYERGDHWAVEALQTGIFTYGATREEAEALNAEANIALIREMKKQGRRALERFLREKAIEYRIGGRKPRNKARQSVKWEGLTQSELAHAA